MHSYQVDNRPPSLSTSSCVSTTIIHLEGLAKRGVTGIEGVPSFNKQAQAGEYPNEEGSSSDVTNGL
jgi:hypothetical protein